VETSERRNPGRIGAELEERTLTFAVDVVTFVSLLPKSDVASIVGRQLLRSGSSIGANYREANRAESPVDFAHKLAVSVKEAAETEYWLQLCQRTSLGPPDQLSRLLREADEIIAILSTILRRARGTR
jgi:four helix bundle protein